MSKRFGNTLQPAQNGPILKSSGRFGKSMNAFSGRKKEKTPHEVLEDLKEKALEKFDPEKIPPTFMYVSVSGLIQSGTVNQFFDNIKIFFR